MPRFYLDLRAHRDAAANGQTPFTPAIAVVYQVDEGLRLMDEEGADGDLRPPRGLRRGRAGRPRGPRASTLFADPAVASKTVTAAWVPEGLDWKAFNGEVKRRGVVLAGGQGKLTGKIFRLGHLGSVTLEEILGAISTLELVSLAAGPRRSSRAPRSPPPRSPPSRRYGLAATAPPAPAREDPRRRARRRARASSSSAPSTRSTSGIGLHPRRAVRDPARLRRARSSAARSRSTPR